MAARILLLGGTAEARQLARQLIDTGHDVTSSLAGRVPNPRLPAGAVRIGGFGGVDGLRNAAVDYDVVVDATHPFAAGITRNAALACLTGESRRPLLRLERPGWGARSGPLWHWVDDHDEAAARAGELGTRQVLTVGRQRLSEFVPVLREHDVVARVVDERSLDLPDRWQVIADRGPYQLAAETALLCAHRADVLVTKDSGGEYTWPKMQAADELGIPVVVIRRPASPPDLQTVHSVESVMGWLQTLT
ncbi:cobalt-precorrin-6A reductase [Gordonia sp. ABSL11-1]|uniref:cobalt-precorrin-6A reductase n=1 Tax=Gordonia sp. ABSL11-1 TaxID=3053924 RepID=UPI002573FC86|nr:cobalt-precorrin-6A reductase [Gordonia sp. ABSL11-1]MDL9948470.1 cobalt-precorrin-6A reductase [Gordonia sp. ABSL11-1]